MGELIKYEFEKICSRRLVWIGLGLLLFFSLITSMFQGGAYVTTRDGETLRGKAAERYIDERTQLYAGLLNDEKREAILENESYEGETEDGYNSAIPLYQAMDWNFGEDGDFEGMTVDEAYTKRGITVEVANTRSWQILFNLTSTVNMFLGVVIAIAVSGVFSEEYTRKTDALILSSKYGKNRCVWAKIIASFLFAGMSYALAILSQAIPFLLKFGLKGINGGVQLDIYNGLCRVPYTLNCGQAAMLLILGGALGMIMATAMTLLISVWSKSSFAAVVIACSLYLAPILLSNILPLALVSLTAVGAGTVPVLTLDSWLHVPFYVWLCALALLWAVASWLGVRRVFARHEVR